MGSSRSKILRALTTPRRSQLVPTASKNPATLLYHQTMNVWYPISLLPPWSDSSQLVPKYKRNTSNNIRRHARVFLKGVPQSSWDVSKIRSWSLIVDLLRNMCLSKSCKIRNKTATLESFFNKVTDTQLY